MNDPPPQAVETTPPDAFHEELPEAPRPPRSATLTRLRIAGFKSFAEPTIVEVLPGLTGIVGPNGCGKSNVVEALRWAMGETSAKSLRGGEMEDVIFAGTATRPGRNLAEVALSLEDAAGLAPPPQAEADDLEIVRRIGRGDGSTFRVNGREVRARDIQTLFADIGSGARASAMVSQGRVAALIAAKPEDRRSVIEEAAGIGGIRARRHEAELKLRAAEANLLRADDLKGQLEAQRQGLQRQARQAARYRNLSGLTRDAEAEWLAILAGRAEAALTSADAALATARAATTEAEAVAEQAALRAFAADRDLPDPRAAEATARTALERRRLEAETLAGAEAAARAALAAAIARRDQIAQDLDHAQAAGRDADAALARLAAEAADLATAEASLPARQATAAEALAEAATAAAAAETALSAATETAAEAAARNSAAIAAAAVAEQRARDGAARHAARLAERNAALAEQVPPATLAAAETAVAAAEAALAEALAALTAAETGRAEATAAADAAARAATADAAARTHASQALAAAREKARALAAEGDRIARDHATALAALTPAETQGAAAATLAAAERAQGDAAAALDQAAATLAAAARAEAAARARAAEAEAARARAGAEAQGLTDLLSARDTGGATPVLDAVTLPPGLEAALGAALGETLESPADDPPFKDLGALRWWRALPLLDPTPALPLGATPLSRLVEAPAALLRALSQVGLLPEGSDGAAMQAALRPGQMLVTAEGALWRWDGHTARAGAPTPGAVRLRQRNALRAARRRLDQEEAAAADALRARQAAEAAATGATADEARARAARDAADAALAAARKHAARLAAEAAETLARIEALAPQRDRSAAEAAAAAAALAEAESALAALPDPTVTAAAGAEAAARSNAATNAEAAARSARQAAERALAEARTAAARLSAQAAGAEARLAALEPDILRLAEDAATAAAALAEARSVALPDLDTLRTASDTARAQSQSARAAEAEARRLAADLAAEAPRLSARRAVLTADAAAWRNRAEDAAARLDALASRQAAALAEVDAAAEAPDDAAARRAGAARSLAEAEAIQAAAAAALTAAETEARAAVEARRQADATFAGARETQVAADAALRAAQTQGQATAARILERLGEDADLPEPPEDLSDAAEEKARRRADRLAREREEMGPVNLRAEIELAEVEDRAATIETDRAEVASAIAKLRGSVGWLNREARERLRAVFDRVDVEFRALFSRLFGGGRAHLALVGSDDPLEAGLEIFAEPPGKKLSSLSLLSGGEQALTALSLIFAVFRCQPAPVCVLDEVDAPLDDANVERLCDLLDHMATEGGTRFLVVTHHPLTMARMHRLYGVTMQERGVSRLLSVDLGRAVELAEGPGAG